MGILVAQTTKRALEASLKKLLLRKPLNKITINDITEDCGVMPQRHWKAIRTLRRGATPSAICWKRCRPTGCWC